MDPSHLAPSAAAGAPGPAKRGPLDDGVAERQAPMDSSCLPELGDKPAWRRLYRQRRRLAMAGLGESLRVTVSRELPALLGPRGRLGLYWPLGQEPDLRPLAALVPDRLALPAVVGDPRDSKRQRLIYRAWQPGDPLPPDRCGIPAPAEGEPLPPEALALLLVPALAIDRQGVRLGSGGGWYDRLRSDPRWRAVPSLVVLPAACCIARLPREPWDIPFDGWISEAGLQLRDRKHCNLLSEPCRTPADDAGLPGSQQLRPPPWI
ncbi:MAG: 5-formyltetrahydrofolate cyclo-ligase [Synechococcaceae cyanobacterium]|nr:5-formyltetrahydrofolate cyclo-ligase [Synechococcaceae cyanobacterium]